MSYKLKENLELCIGCGRCEQQCPVEGANIIYKDEDGNTKIKIDKENCAACGRCISLCPQKARNYDYDE
ncbi:MAG: 4Fe-4S binding protein [Oscillospiraceae bacterium]|nr:4Fe-4S binding protein [Oscillospiraceae bacterium]